MGTISPTSVYGADDDVVPVERSREMIAALVAAGGQPRYTELPGVGHDAWTPAYTGPDSVLPWLFAQRRMGTVFGFAVWHSQVAMRQRRRPLSAAAQANPQIRIPSPLSEPAPPTGRRD